MKDSYLLLSEKTIKSFCNKKGFAKGSGIKYVINDLDEMNRGRKNKLIAYDLFILASTIARNSFDLFPNFKKETNLGYDDFVLHILNDLRKACTYVEYEVEAD